MKCEYRLLFNLNKWGRRIKFCLYRGFFGMKWDNLNKDIVLV